MTDLRIRQLVIAANDLSTADALRAVLDLGAPYPDPGVGEFGLINAVFAIGDQFLEVIVPTRDDAPARRFINRQGEGGYMIIFQVPDIEQARSHADALGITRVWNSDYPEVSASHFHPKGLGAIISVDEPRPVESWKWGGPDWETQSTPGSICGADFTSPDPAMSNTRWHELLNGKPATGNQLATTDGPVTFIAGETTGLSGFHLAVLDPDAAIGRARSLGLPTKDHLFWCANVEFHLSPLGR